MEFYILKFKLNGLYIFSFSLCFNRINHLTQPPPQKKIKSPDLGSSKLWKSSANSGMQAEKDSQYPQHFCTALLKSVDPFIYHG